jgi:LCP family protein required for cell wall assembly
MHRCCSKESWMDDLAQLRNFRAGIAPPTEAVRARARRAWNVPTRVAGRPSRRFGARFAVALVTVTALVTVAVVAIDHLVDRRVADIPRVSLGRGVLEPVAAGKLPQNILILGVDDRAPDVDASAPRSDTMILLRVRHHSAHAVWFPRDLLVQIPGEAGLMPLNQASVFGGPRLVIDTFKANFDLSVNHYVELDARGLRDVVDALGGIRVAFPEALRDELSGLQVPAGCVRVDGATAVALARSRRAEALRNGSWQTADLRADLDRVQRQQELIGVLAATVHSEIEHHPQRLLGLLDAFLRHVRVDDTFDRDELLRLARIFAGGDGVRLETEVLPVAASPTDANRLTAAAGSDTTLQHLGGAIASSTLASAPPTAGGELRGC